MTTQKKVSNNNKQTKKYIRNRARRNREKLKIQIGGNILTSLYDSFIQWLKEIGIIERDDNERVARLKDLKQQMSKHSGRTIYGKSKNDEKTKMREKKADEYKLLEKKYSDIKNKKESFWCRFSDCDASNIEHYEINSNTTNTNSNSTNSNTETENDDSRDSNTNSSD
jgi:hypothetical protein|tara:strand:+ start:84 stop:587 length:504 start_codon:yes stop_codon:yes gene_type:complete